LGLKLQLVKDGEVIEEIPLSPDEGGRDKWISEMERSQDDITQMCKLFELYTNENRLRMMRRLLQEDDFMLSFTQFVKGLHMNPKTAREHALRLMEAGFLEKPERGKYRLSPLATSGGLTAGFALRRIIRILRSELERTRR
jgi:DNA-binding transcriptional ArsR family regulator